MTPREYLAGLEFHGIKLGLDNIRILLESVGNPHLACPSVHVAGTNGKGSVTAFLAAMLYSAGYRVGRFTSPHLLDVSERFLVNGSPINDANLDRIIENFRASAATMANPPTYFELCTAVAFQHFAEQKVDIAVIEVGMGGRFDSTNVLEPVACAITNIAFDHMKYLGNSLAEIAFEKAGIIKPRTPVVVGENTREALDVIEKCAQSCSVPMLLRGRDFKVTPRGKPLAPRMDYRGGLFEFCDVPIALNGMHQVENAAVAIALAELLVPTFANITTEAVEDGLRAAKWPCRLQRVLDAPPVYIDVAHNPAGIARLAESMPKSTVVFAVSADKDAHEMIAGILPVARRLILTQYDGPRSLKGERLAALAERIQTVPCEIRPSFEDAIKAGMTHSTEESPLLITGSIFAAGQAFEVLMERYDAAPPSF